MNRPENNEQPAREDLMPYEINIHDGRPWVHARVFEPVSKALALDLLKAAAGQARQHGVGRLLIDARGAPSVKTTVEDYHIANYKLHEFGFERSAKFAIVVDPEDETHNFFETCTINAGYEWRIFSDADLAARWINAAQPVR